MNKYKVSVFIQWLAHKNLLDEWLELVLLRGNEENVVERIHASPGEALYRSFDWGAAASRGYSNWQVINREWLQVYNDICAELIRR